MRLIDGDALKQKFEFRAEDFQDFECRDIIDNAPTIEPDADGCNYCLYGAPLKFAEDGMKRCAQISVDGKTIVADLYNDYMWADINFCPMCGRKV